MKMLKVNDGKRDYVKPEFEVVEFCSGDVVTASGGLETNKFSDKYGNVNRVYINF